MCVRRIRVHRFLSVKLIVLSAFKTKLRYTLYSRGDPASNGEVHVIHTLCAYEVYPVMVGAGGAHSEGHDVGVSGIVQNPSPQITGQSAGHKDEFSVS